MDRQCWGKCPSGFLQSVRGAAAVTTHLCILGLDQASVLSTYPEERCSKEMDGVAQIIMAKMGQGQCLKRKTLMFHKL
jgi:hypothetical protein